MAIARWYRAAMTVLHVHRLPTPLFAAAPVAMPAVIQPISLTEDEVRHYLEGNICRCTGYHGIVAAVMAASGQDVAVAAE